MSLHSDIDLLLLVPSRGEPPAAAVRGLLYPLWDEGFQVGHATVTPKGAMERASELDAATSVLSARLVGGEDALFQELLDRRARWVARHGRRLTQRIVDAVSDRHDHVDRAGWSLAPDLKDDNGGLRDLHALGWLSELAGVQGDDDFSEARGVLMAVREALHLQEGRKLDRVRIDLQPSVARRLGFDGEDGRDEMMAEVHSAARDIEHRGAAARQRLAERLLGGPRRSGSVQRLSESVSVVDGSLHASGGRAKTLEGALEVLGAVASTGKLPDHKTSTQLAAAFRRPPLTRWDREVLAGFVAILQARRVEAALELLDHLGGWPVLIPEWQHVRGLAQHDPYHRYTVDGHSFGVVGQVSRAIDEDPVAHSAALEAGDLEALYIAALLHDIGKGTGQDHSAAGARIALGVCERMGLDAGITDDVVKLVGHHLLLVDTAARRDISDTEVIRTVSSALGDGRVARMLYVLSVADGTATGPEGWSSWKASLVRQLYVKVVSALETGIVQSTTSRRARAADVARVNPTLGARAEELLESLPLSYLDAAAPAEMAEELELLAGIAPGGGVATLVRPAAHPGLVVAVTDRSGALARTAGVLALHRLGVLHAEAISTSRGLALQRFVVDSEPGSWDELIQDIEAAYSGILALDARLEQKIGDYRPATPPRCEITVLPDESEHSTVVEVRASDALGLLYAVASALTGLDLDIHIAKIDTLAARVVDVFYLRTARGTKIPEGRAAEIERAIAHRMRVFFGG